MGTTKETLLAAVDKLVASVKNEGDANAAKASADASVTVALQSQSSASADQQAAHAQVTADVAALQDFATKFADDDPNT